MLAPVCIHTIVHWKVGRWSCEHLCAHSAGRSLDPQEDSCPQASHFHPLRILLAVNLAPNLSEGRPLHPDHPRQAGHATTSEVCTQVCMDVCMGRLASLLTALLPPPPGGCLGQ